MHNTEKFQLYNFFVIFLITVSILFSSCNNKKETEKIGLKPSPKKQKEVNLISAKIIGPIKPINEICTLKDAYCNRLKTTNYLFATRISLTNHSTLDYRFALNDSIFFIQSFSIQFSDGHWEERIVSFNNPKVFPNLKGVVVKPKDSIQFYFAYPSEDIKAFSGEAGGLDGGEKIWKPVLFGLTLEDKVPKKLSYIVSSGKSIP